MPATFFLVRAVVVAPLREKFDVWYATDHLPWAVKAFKCEKAWRFWSALEPGVHYAVYRFADKASCDAALATDEFRALVTDFDRAFPTVNRTRDVLTLAEERGVGCVILMVRSAAKPRVSNHAGPGPILRDGRGACHRAALRADPLAPSSG